MGSEKAKVPILISDFLLSDTIALLCPCYICQLSESALHFQLQMSLILSGDVEENPGPDPPGAEGGGFEGLRLCFHLSPLQLLVSFQAHKFSVPECWQTLLLALPTDGARTTTSIHWWGQIHHSLSRSS